MLPVAWGERVVLRVRALLLRVLVQALALVLSPAESRRRSKDAVARVALPQHAEQRQPLVLTGPLAVAPWEAEEAAEPVACRCLDRKSETASCNRDRPRLGRSVRRVRRALVRRLGNEQQQACVTPLSV